MKGLLLMLITFTGLCFGQRTRSFADSIRIAYKIPEVGYAVIDSKTILEISALGKHSTELADIATIDDSFHIGSNTKAMTAFIIAKFVENGKLKCITKFFDIFPEWKKKSNPMYQKLPYKICSHTEQEFNHFRVKTIQ